MRLIGNLILRLVAIFFGVLVALLAASVFIAIGLFGGIFENLFSDLQLANQSEPGESFSLVGLAVLLVGFFSSFHVAGVTALPATLAIGIAELMRWRGMTINLLLGGVVGLFAGFSAFRTQLDGLPSEGTLIVFLATGFVGGFFYWLIAGRGAGNWLPARNKEPIDVIDKFGRQGD